MHRLPKYRLHKPSQLAVVTLRGKDHYLGKYESPESWQHYHRLLLAEYDPPQAQSGPVQTMPEAAPPPHLISVNELILRFWQFAKEYYVKNGQPTSELDNLRHALGFLRRAHGEAAAVAFGPKALKSVMDAMIHHPVLRRRRDPQSGVVQQVLVARGLTRRVINKHLSRLKRVFAWAVAEELLPAHVHEALLRVPGLRRGRTPARERPRIRPVADEHIQAVLKFLPLLVAVMVQVHRLCGCRSQDLLGMRGIDIHRGGPIWEYRPAHYKTEHLNDDNDPDQERVIYLGPKVQELLRPHLLEDPQAYIFSPRRAEALRLATLRQKRRTPLYPSHVKRYQQQKAVKSPLRDFYDDNSYRRAVQRACQKAGVPVWTPKRLRHTRLTEIRRLHGLEAAKACAGHREIGVTQHYAEQDQTLARRIMLERG